MDDFARFLRQTVHQQINAYVLPCSQAPGSSDKHRVDKAACGYLFGPREDKIEDIAGEDIRNDQHHRDSEQRARGVGIEIFQDVLGSVFQAKSTFFRGKIGRRLPQRSRGRRSFQMSTMILQKPYGAIRRQGVLRHTL